jgi:hypothetical protein
MNNLEKLISVQNVSVPLLEYVFNLILTVILSLILSYLFNRYGRTFSNRKMFGNNFVLLSTATMIVITIVKSSLALSLGLVGALSIVRFRTAVKEPEELVYLFLCITIGLGFGANQREVTLVGFVIVVAILIIGNFYRQKSDIQNLHLVVRSKNDKKNILEDIVAILKHNCIDVELKRFDEQKENFEVAFYVQFHDFANLSMLKNDLKSISSIEQISFFDSQGVA